MNNQVKKSSEITIKVDLDENNLPMSILWNAKDGAVKDAEARAFMLSLWDAKSGILFQIE